MIHRFLFISNPGICFFIPLDIHIFHRCELILTTWFQNWALLLPDSWYFCMCPIYNHISILINCRLHSLCLSNAMIPLVIDLFFIIRKKKDLFLIERWYQYLWCSLNCYIGCSDPAINSLDIWIYTVVSKRCTPSSDIKCNILVWWSFGLCCILWWCYWSLWSRIS